MSSTTTTTTNHLNKEIRDAAVKARNLRNRAFILAAGLAASAWVLGYLEDKSSDSESESESSSSKSEGQEIPSLLKANRLGKDQKTRLARAAAQQQAHNQQCLYRVCAGVTTFRARDPDPHAVDGGAILGIRIEVLSRGRFLRPYYVLLNRPYSSGAAADGSGNGVGENGNARRQGKGKTWLRVHRHTLPACIPVAGLAARYLPAPPKTGDDVDGGRDEGRAKIQEKQDLARFARAVRREVIRYHNRLGVVGDLRRAAGLDKKADGETAAPEEEAAAPEEEGPGRLLDITASDAEAKHITIEWADGRIGRLVMGDDGEIVKLVVVGRNGRDREAERELLGGAVRVDELARRLAASARRGGGFVVSSGRGGSLTAG
ncbi:hypothetical protein N656DRAFT_773647 [Canariomyces notabilis]|uniref:Uncharacterized protein n=1 Tax=Canariomyces notabilis TaxID=2074819 RepID=A0AAN6TMZ5_9PEZI|nr:hypothetical protein N656DRAFT_773647 [Canariomyces arenarius]